MISHVITALVPLQLLLICLKVSEILRALVILLTVAFIIPTLDGVTVCATSCTLGRCILVYRHAIIGGPAIIHARRLGCLVHVPRLGWLVVYRLVDRRLPGRNLTGLEIGFWELGRAEVVILELARESSAILGFVE